MRWTAPLIAIGGLLLASAIGAHAQKLPDGPITVVIPFSAGGTSDVALRLFVDVIEHNTGRHIVIVNKPGGGGVIAAMAVKGATPDGTTIRLADIGTDAILPALQSVPYDSLKDFEPIALLMSWGQFITVPASSPAHNVKELVEYGKAKPGGLNMGSQGIGSGGHLLGAMFQTATGLKFTHVPFKGGQPLAIDLMAGRVDFAFNSYREMKAPLDEGKVRMLAAASAQRSKSLPDLPTLAEVGIKGVELSPWFGLVAPAGTPKPVVQAIHDAFEIACKDPQLQKRLLPLAIDSDVTTPESFAAYIASERDKYEKVVKEHGIKTQ
jgi:tripartite-type tricarboxylate transporter receptor subunit TctC